MLFRSASNVNQSTTGNIYGIYDMNGTSWEYVAGVLDSKLSNGSKIMILQELILNTIMFILIIRKVKK